MKNESVKLIRVPTDYLLNEDRVIDFNIYTRRSGNNEPLLLIPANTDLDRVRELLARKNHGPLFITEDAADNFQNFIESSIGSIIKNPAIPLNDKTTLVHACARNIMQDVFANPRSGRNIRRVHNITNTIIHLTISDQDSIPNLLRLGSHDYYTFSHCINVAVFGIGLWLRVNKEDERELLDFSLGCILHDVGKTEIQNRILTKPGKLTPEEFKLIMEHPRHGYNLMAEHASAKTLDIILHHHEKIDGQGYPHGLRDEQISSNAKIAAIADVYDALTTNRPYAHARRSFNALTLMKQEMVGHFAEKTFNDFILFLGNRPS